MARELLARRGTVDIGPPDPARHAFFLDFDGTLVDIAARPSDVVLDAGTTDLLRALKQASDGALAIVSGRPLDDIAALTAAIGPTLVGTHGVEIRREDVRSAVSPKDQAVLDGVGRRLSELALTHGLLLEMKPGAVALHYRGRADLADLCKDAVAAAARDAELRILAGNMVCEAVLTGYDKGRAIKTLMAEAPFRGRIPLMIGDDITDEDGFRAAQSLGGTGVSIGRPESCARLVCPDRHWALDWLREGLTRHA